MSDDEYAERPKKSRQPKKRKSRGDDDEADFDAGFVEDDEEETYRAPKEKKSRGIEGLTPDEKDRYVGEIIRYIVLSETTKTYAARADVAKIVLQPHGASKMAGPLLPLAADKLKRVFGWDLISIPSFTPKGKFDAAGTRDFTTRLTPQLEEFMAPIRDELPTPPDFSFLMIVLSLILMHNFEVEETQIYKELVPFGIQADVPHKSFGGKKPSDMMKDLAKQHYLSLKKGTENGITTHQIHIGSRSLVEIGKVNILRFINSICKTSVDPSAFKEFTDEQASFLPQYARGDDLTASAEPAAAAPPAETIEDDEPPTQRGRGASQENGHSQVETSPSQPNRRGKRSRA